jgi:lysophospholipase L1-like esterase
MRTSPLLTLLGLLLLLPAASHADLLKDKKRILFLGDSITHGGFYIVRLEAALRATHPDAEFINLGLPSEGCTGLSEPKHPFPRPSVHERLDRALERIKPDLVFACYGMNDGIYYPFSNERFGKYMEGINALIAKVAKSGADLILLTPPPFDPLPLKAKGKLLPAEAPEFSWMEIYEHYDRDVIAPYGKWILAQHDRVAAVIDLHAPVAAHVEEQRKTNPDFVLSGDGVHLDTAGHLLLAEAIHQALYHEPLPEVPAAAIDLVGKQQTIMQPAWLSHVGHQRPGVAAGLPLEEARKQADALKPE